MYHNSKSQVETNSIEFSRDDGCYCCWSVWYKEYGGHRFEFDGEVGARLGRRGNEKARRRPFLVSSLPSKSMQIVSPRKLWTFEITLISVVVAKNHQNNGDRSTSASSISWSALAPGMADSRPTKANTSTADQTNTARRHLYRSVMAPAIGLTTSPGIGCSVNIVPTMNAE